MSLNAGMMSSARPSWNTPEEVLKLVRRVGPIALDPCGGECSIVRAEIDWRIERGENGLECDWVGSVGSQITFTNPPYGRAIGAWVRKCAAEAERGAQVIALLPARTDAKWFAGVWTAKKVCFWRGRLKFLGAPSSAPFPSVVAYWGDNGRRFAEVFRTAGKIVTP